MTQQDASSASSSDQPQEDPWQAFSYLVSGVLLYGFLGWLADRFLGTSYLVVVGILLGAGLGIYLVLKRFGHRPGKSEQTK